MMMVKLWRPLITTMMMLDAIGSNNWIDHGDCCDSISQTQTIDWNEHGFSPFLSLKINSKGKSENLPIFENPETNCPFAVTRTKIHKKSPLQYALKSILRGGNDAYPFDIGIQKLDYDNVTTKYREKLLPWQKRRRRPRPRDHVISGNSPFGKVLPMDRPPPLTYEERRRQLLGSYAEAHARAQRELPEAVQQGRAMLLDGSYAGLGPSNLLDEDSEDR
jgi:hypothetical protein